MSTVVTITSGSTFTVPSDFSSLVSIECYGGGQGGQGSSFNTTTLAGSPGQGGAGGSYAKITSLVLTANQVVNIAIGAAGTAGPGGTNSAGLLGGAGGDTWFDSSSTVLAPGGSSASAAVGSVTFAGGPGGSGASVQGGGGGCAGPTGAGGAGSTTAGGAGGGGDAGAGAWSGTDGQGANGNPYGGGGEGAGTGAQTGAFNGGTGAAGVIVFTYNAGGTVHTETLNAGLSESGSVSRQVGEPLPGGIAPSGSESATLLGQIRATQIAAEALAGDASRIRTTQVAGEALAGNPSNVRTTQIAVEVLSAPGGATLGAALTVAPLGKRLDILSAALHVGKVPSTSATDTIGAALVVADVVRPAIILGIFEAEELQRNILVVRAAIPRVRSTEIVSLRLYRAPTATGPWSPFTARPVDPYDVETLLFDPSPAAGAERWYAIAAIDGNGTEGPKSKPLSYAAYGPGTISNGAYGPYALLGQDVFVDPATGEAVVGPNGDPMTVTGLACLAQDLRLRILSAKGELLLHPDYGFGWGKTIGAGQARRKVQAQMLRADIVDAVTADPRVESVLMVEISEIDAYSWLVSYVVQPIGVEDPQRLNLVYPFFEAGGA